MGAPATTVTADSATELLSDLAALPVGDRLPRLRVEDDAETTLIAMAEACDRKAATEVAAALAASEMLTALADELGSPRAQSAARRARAASLSYAGDYQASLLCSADAAAMADEGGFEIEAARARLATIQPLAQLGRYDDAIAAGEAARAALTAAGQAGLAARADISIGAVYDMREDHARALAHYDRALPLLRDDLMMEAQLESNRGIALMGLDQFAAAELAFHAAVNAFASLKLDWAAAIAEGNLAYMATRQGRLERAMLHFEEARRCVEADESPGDLARLLAEQADALAALGLPAEAARTYERALPDLETHGLALEAAHARAGLGCAQIRLGRFDRADATLDDAAQRFDRLGQDVARARLDLTRSELAAKRDRWGDARLLAADALDVLAGRPSDEALARSRIAGLDLKLGDVESAAAQIGAALPIAERLDLVPLRASLLHLRGRVARERGDLGEALSEFRAAIEQVERVRGTLQAERFRTGFLGDHVAVYDDALQAALDQHPPDIATAFAMVEHAKSRALLDLVAGALDLVEDAERDATDQAEARLLADLARVRATVNWYYSGSDDEGRSGEPQAAETRRRTIHVLEQELGDLEDRLASTKGVAGLFAPPINLEAALRRVPDSAALIEYYVAGTEVLAIVLRGEEATVVRRLATGEDVDDRVRRLQLQIGRAVASAGRAPNPDRAARLLADARRELRALFDLLIAPLESEIANAARLIVVPHSALHAIPFGALWDGRQHLIESREIVMAPSVSVLAQVETRQHVTEADEALIFGVPDALAPRIEAEVKAVGSILGATPVLRSEATTDRLRRAAPKAHFVHLACHGRFDAEHPMASGLKLADRWLTVRDMYGLRLNGPLVVLSGCETGKAAVGSGDELLGLVRAFFAAGASSLLLSLWVADDESTMSMMVDFYRALSSGESPAGALREAQCAQLARQPHPAFWAPFVLGGHA